MGDQPTRPTQPFILTGSINRVPTCPVGAGEGGAVTSVGWQITLCDLEADRISFYFSFTVPNKRIFLFFGILFFGRKTGSFFVFFIFRYEKPP